MFNFSAIKKIYNQYDDKFLQIFNSAPIYNEQLKNSHTKAKK